MRNKKILITGVCGFIGFHLSKHFLKNGFKVVVFTSRNMRTYKGNIGLIKSNTLPIILDWLKKK